MLELFDFLWKASSAGTPFLPERFYDEYHYEEFDDDENYDKMLTLTICLKSDIRGKVSHLQSQGHCQKKV